MLRLIVKIKTIIMKKQGIKLGQLNSETGEVIW